MTPDQVKYVLDTMWLLVTGALVMWMAAGFAMLETGLTQSKNTVTILCKNLTLYSAACIMYWIVGYNIMYGEGGAFMSFGWLLHGFTDGAHSRMSDFFFQVVFVATAASIVSGAMAERTKFWPFMLFTAILTAVIYPIQGHWSWGGSALGGIMTGFTDFAGSTVVHSVGGWAALAGVLVVGPRQGRYPQGGGVKVFPGSNMPLATLGTFVLWLGWFGFNGGSQLALGSVEDVNAVSRVIVNTNMAACAGGLAAMILTQVMYRKVDLSMVLNGTLAGLVGITAGPNYSGIGIAVLVGVVAGILVVFAVPAFDKLKLDDPVGALSVHLVCGIWGTLAVGIFDPSKSFVTQLIGVLLVGAFVFASSLVTWVVIRALMGLRVTDQVEQEGIDLHEFGMEAYAFETR
jgi:ammonium transporter, Amt family